MTPQDASKSRNGAVHPMLIESLLYASLNCQDTDAIMLRIKKHSNLPPKMKVELIETVKESNPECKWDAND